MRLYALALGVLLLFGNAQAQVDSVLFVGNSYTYGNNLPNLFQNLSAAAGDTFHVESITAGGYTLQSHLSNTTHLNKITQRHWDYFIVQDQSQVPTIDHYFNNLSIPSAIALDSYFKSKNSCAKTYYFMTWGRRFGGQQCDLNNTHCSVNFTDFDHMQDTLKSRYLTLAAQVDASVSPVGEAWRLALQDTTGLVLHTTDNSHPNLHGSYLAACTHYASLTGKSPLGISYTAGLNAAWANYLQRKAAEAVLDSLSVYNIDVLEPPFQLVLSGRVSTADFICTADSINSLLSFDYSGHYAADSLSYQLLSYAANGTVRQRDTASLDLIRHCEPVSVSTSKAVAMDRRNRYLMLEMAYQDSMGTVFLEDTLASFPYPTDLLDSSAIFLEAFTPKSYASSADFWKAEYDSSSSSGWRTEVDAALLLGQAPVGPAGSAVAELPATATAKRLVTPCLKLYDTLRYEIRFRHTNHRTGSFDSLGFQVSFSDTSSFASETLIRDRGLRYDSTYQTFIDTFTVAQSGSYYLGIAAYRSANPSGTALLGIDDFQLKALPPALAPVATAEATKAHATFDFQIHPNPSADYFYCSPSRAALLQDPTVALRVYDLSGRDWSAYLQRETESRYGFDLAPGLYVLVLERAGRPLAQQRLLVQPSSR